MSKSELSDLSRINLNDDKDQIINKIKKAKTDPLPMPKDIKEQITKDIEDNFKPEWKSILQEKTLEGIVNYMNNTNIDSTETIQYIKDIDKIRNQNYCDLFPQMKKYING